MKKHQPLTTLPSLSFASFQLTFVFGFGKETLSFASFQHRNLEVSIFKSLSFASFQHTPEFDRDITLDS